MSAIMKIATRYGRSTSYTIWTFMVLMLVYVQNFYFIEIHKTILSILMIKLSHRTEMALKTKIN